MTRNILTSIALALILLVAQFGIVLAAQDPTPITGTVQTITLETDETSGETTVVVTVLDSAGTTQTLRLSTETAASLGLITTDAVTGVSTVNDAAIGTTVQVDPATVITDTETDEARHPVGSALADFFGSQFGVDYETIMEYHDDGTGFGVIAQALWMTRRLEGDAATFQLILDAKKSGDYSAVTLPDGSTPSNWGQFKKALLNSGDHENLGTVMSDRGDNANPGQEHRNNNKDRNRDKEKHNNRP